MVGRKTLASEIKLQPKNREKYTLNIIWTKKVS